MSLFFKSRVIRVGRSIGVIIPKEETLRWNIEIGDILNIDVEYINRNERERYQEDVKRKRSGRRR